VGVNAFVDDAPGSSPPNQTLDGGESLQLDRLARVRRERDAGAVQRALADLRSQALDPEINLMGALISAGRARASVGEIMNTLAEVFGRHQVRPR